MVNCQWLLWGEREAPPNASNNYLCNHTKVKVLLWASVFVLFCFSLCATGELRLLSYKVLPRCNLQGTSAACGAGQGVGVDLGMNLCFGFENAQVQQSLSMQTVCLC